MKQLLIAFAIAIWWPIGLNAATLDYSDTLRIVSDALRGFSTVDNRENWGGDNLMSDNTDSTHNDTVCAFQFQYLLDGLNRTQEYALKFFDAWGRPPSGMLSGNFYGLGSFDECLDYTHQPSPSDLELIRGQYCLVTIRPDSDSFKQQRSAFQNLDLRVNLGPSSSTSSLYLSLGVCAPAACSPQTLKTQMNNVLNMFNLTANGYNQADFCYVKEDTHFSTADWCALIVFAVVGLLMVASTLYEVYTQYYQKPQILILKAFSVCTNSKKLLTTQKPTSSPDHVGCINGIRVLSIVWVVVCHGYLLYTVAPLQNGIYLTEWIGHYSSMLLVSGTLSVDTFFLMSGMLLTMSALRELDRNGKFNLPLMYLHRYLRLTPPFAALILFSSTLIRYVWTGPFWKQMQRQTVEPCQKNWWSALLYLQNYVNPKEICLGHSWYLSVDMQLYILSPIILYPLWRYGKKFVAVIFLLILGAMSCAFVTMIINGFQVGWTTLDKDNNRMNKIYYPTHIRMHSWLVGVLIGYILHLTKHRRIKLSKTVVSTGWIGALAMMCALIFGPYPFQQFDYSGPLIYDAFYEATCRVLWSIAVGWVIFACINGYGGWVNGILSWPAFQPLGKLSYSIYLVHMVLQTIQSAAIRHPRYFTNTTVMHAVWGDFGLTLTICVLWSLAFESPITIIEKYLFRLFQQPRRVTQPPTTTTASTTTNGSQETLTASKEC